MTDGQEASELKPQTLKVWLARGWQVFNENRTRLIHGSLLANLANLIVLIGFIRAYAPYTHKASFGYLIPYGVFSWVLSAGWFWYCQDYANGERAPIARIFSAFVRPSILVLAFVLFLIGFVAINVMLVFGLFAVGRYAFSFYLARDGRRTLVEAIRASAAITKGHRMKLGFMYLMANIPPALIILTLLYQKSDFLQLLLLLVWLGVFPSLMTPWFGVSMSESYSDLSRDFEGDVELSKERSRFAITKTVVFAVPSLILILMFSFPHVLITMLSQQRFPKSTYPMWYEKPAPRTVKTSGHSWSPDREHAVRDLVFEAPWSSPFEQKEYSRALSLKFSGDRRVVLIQGYPSPLESFDETILKTVPSDDDRRKIPELNMEHLDYSTLHTILSTTPYNNDRDHVRAQVLLFLKLDLFPPGTDDSVYSFKTNEVKGFQYGNAGKPKKVVVCHFFDDKGVFYQLVLRNANQSEVDFVLSSIKRQD